MSQVKNSKILKLTQMGILIAIMIIFHITGIGYIKIFAVELTIMMIPVVIGAIVCGPLEGGILGGVFGLTSFLQCFGTSAFGVLIFELNPLATVIMCFVPRILVGVLSAYIFRWLSKVDKTKTISFAVSSLSAALLNTLLFMLCLIVFFWNNASFIGKMAEWSLPTDDIWAFAVAFVGINGAIEAAACFIVGALISKALVTFLPKTE